MSYEQHSVVQAFLDGHDVFACLPTGCGKSLCYWILPGVFDRLRGLDSYRHYLCYRPIALWTLVVAVIPLKALMREQVEALKGRGSRAVCVGDALYEELVHGEIQEGRYQFLFIGVGTMGEGGGEKALIAPPSQSWAS